MGSIEEALESAGAGDDLQTILQVLKDNSVSFKRHESAAGPFANMHTATLTGLNPRMLSATQNAQQQQLQEQQQRQGVNLISAETRSLLSAFLAVWDESRRKNKAKSAQVSDIDTNIWLNVRHTACLTIASHEAPMVPTHIRSFPTYQWDHRCEGSQADKYLPYFQQNIKIDTRVWQRVNVSRKRHLLTQFLLHSLGYNFRGGTDMILCSRNSVRSNIYTTGMRILVEVKESPICDDTYQAMVVLLLANILNPKCKPVVVLTDLDDSWVFFWLENRCIWHSAEDRATVAGIIEDMLHKEKVKTSEVQPLSKEDYDRLGIFKRQVFNYNVGAHVHQQDTSLLDTINCLPAEEAAITKVEYILDLFSQIPGVPATVIERTGG